MRMLALLMGMAGFWHAGAAEPQMFCDATELISEYERARDNEIPDLDRLLPSEKTALIGQYNKLLAIVDEQLVLTSGNKEPRLRPDAAVSGLKQGREDAADATIGLYMNIALSMVPASEWGVFREDIERSIAALDGSSNETFGQVQDRINREVSENMLRRAWCPDDLDRDYGVSAYNP